MGIWVEDGGYHKEININQYDICDSETWCLLGKGEWGGKRFWIGTRS
jgi:hypothetical protein